MAEFKDTFFVIRNESQNHKRIIAGYTSQRSAFADADRRATEQPNFSFDVIKSIGNPISNTEFETSVSASGFVQEKQRAFDVPLNSDRRSATLTSIRNQPALKFLDAGGTPNANDSAEWALKAPPPPGASGFNLSIVWVPENAASGFVKFRITVDTFKPDVALNSLPTVTENFDTPDKSYTSEVVVQDLLKFHHDVRKHYKLRLQRRDGPDTLSTDVYVLGLSLRYF